MSIMIDIIYIYNYTQMFLKMFFVIISTKSWNLSTNNFNLHRILNEIYYNNLHLRNIIIMKLV